MKLEIWFYFRIKVVLVSMRLFTPTGRSWNFTFLLLKIYFSLKMIQVQLAITVNYTVTKPLATESIFLPPLHLHRSATGWLHVCYIWGLFHMLFVQQRYFIHAHSSMFWMFGISMSRYTAYLRPSTLTLSCILPCENLRELSRHKYIKILN